MPSSVTASSGGETTIGFPAIENGGFRSDNDHTDGGGAIWGENGDRASSAKAAVVTTLGIKMGLILVIPHVDNGGCTKEGGILRLRGAGHLCSGSHRSSSWHRLACPWEGIRDPHGRWCR